MFFKKRKEEKVAMKAVELETQKDFLERLQAQLKDIEGTADVGERLFKLEKAKDDIRGELERVREAKTPSGWPVFWGSSAAQVGILGGLSIATGQPYILFAIAGAIPSAAGGVVYENRQYRLYREEHKGYTDGLTSQMNSVSEMKDKILNGPLEPIVASARVEQVFINYPSVKERFFTAAAIKQVLENRQATPPVTSPKKPSGDKPELGF